MAEAFTVYSFQLRPDDFTKFYGAGYSDDEDTYSEKEEKNIAEGLFTGGQDIGLSEILFEDNLMDSTFSDVFQGADEESTSSDEFTPSNEFGVDIFDIDN